MSRGHEDGLSMMISGIAFDGVGRGREGCAGPESYSRRNLPHARSQSPSKPQGQSKLFVICKGVKWIILTKYK